MLTSRDYVFFSGFVFIELFDQLRSCQSAVVSTGMSTGLPKWSDLCIFFFFFVIICWSVDAANGQY